MHISVDCDGKIWKQNYPDLGELLPGAKNVINYLYDRGHTIVINTCRANHFAENAKAYLINNGIKFNFFNENDPKLISKYGTDTRKVSADAYLDDRSLDELIAKKMLGTKEYEEEIWQQHLEQFQFIERPVIIAIVGESGSGKSLAAEYLENVYDINLVQSYTDREKRYDGEAGHTFLSVEEYDNLVGDVLAKTVFGGSRYCCLENDLIHMNVYIIDEDGLEMLKANYDHAYDIHSLRIYRSLFDRIEAVGEERCNRDKERFTMKDTEFDHVIHNNLNEKEYLYTQIEEFMSLFRLRERSKDYDIHIID